MGGRMLVSAVSLEQRSMTAPKQPIAPQIPSSATPPAPPPQPQRPTPAENLKAILASPSYLRAYEDLGLMHRTELRPIRLQLELLKAEMLLQEEGIESTIVLFGSARTPPREEAEARVEAASLRFRDHPDD